MDDTMDVPMVELVCYDRDNVPIIETLPVNVAVYLMHSGLLSEMFTRARIIAACDLGQWDRTP